ncbi:hypothetical protein Acy02nite_89400 [Actinoplanes cyaneus]|uniref:Uncharacterized protein n=1 Tax=Actinoplanes cyaneus TaxID=52696 RepID=A0A919MCV1_9ACTN|nr:hypothetical protein [Actinoplanes cyaneus]MCW2144287.1 hypothetical protein [Actinoplanes cyaneus]GID71059.1 hypothetical protein Acy02nite_89400 [Actinoplanes cyaneus]
MIETIDSFEHGVPWGVLRVEGVGSSSPTPDLDIAFSMVAANEGCVLVAVLHLDIDKVVVTIAREGKPEGVVQMYSGQLATPSLVLEVADVVGDDFSYRYSVSSERPKVTVLADNPEEAAKVWIVIPEVLGKAD